MLIESFTEALSPAFDGTAIDWIEQNVILPHSARSKQFRRDFAPWLNDIIEDCTNDTTRQICVKAPTGGAKTTLLEVLVPYIIAQKAGPMQINGQTDDTAKEWAETRLIPVLEACEPVAKLFPRNRHDKRKTTILFPHMPLLINGANLTSLQEKSMRYEYGDEVWQWKRGMIREMKARHHDRWNRKTILVSQGWDEGHDMDTEWSGCTEYTWGFTCPDCRNWQRYAWDQIKYTACKNGETYDWPETCKTVHYKCQHCDRTFQDNAKERRMLTNVAMYRQTSPDGMAGHVARTYPAYAVWWISWADMVMEWIIANDEKSSGNHERLRQFVMKRKAEVWRLQDTTPEVHLMAADYTMAEYADGNPWDGESMRFMTVDKQRDHFWHVIRAWTADGGSRLLSEGKLFTWPQVKQTQERMKVMSGLVFVDAQHMTQEVYEHCASNGWTAIHGSGERAFMKRTRSGKTIYRPYTDVRTASPPGCSYIMISVDTMKDKLAILRGGFAAPWELPKDVTSEYRAQMNSEIKKQIVTNRITGATAFRWCQIQHRGNHLWDCETYQTAAAMMMGLLPLPDEENKDTEETPAE